jgi:hypothetical protein
MKVSLQLIPEQPAEELVAAVQVADELGFYACYSADEIYHKDGWLLLVAVAVRPRGSVSARVSPWFTCDDLRRDRDRPPRRRRPGHLPRPHRAARSPGAARLPRGAVRRRPGLRGGIGTRRHGRARDDGRGPGHGGERAVGSVQSGGAVRVAQKVPKRS